MSDMKVEATPQTETTGPLEDGQPVTQAMPQQSYPVVYPYVDSYGAPIGHGAPQTVLPTYYFQTPQVYGYPMAPSAPHGSHDEGMLSVPSFYGMPAAARPIGTPDGSSVLYGTWPSNGAPDAFYTQAPSMAYTYGQALPNGQWVGCACADCRTPASSHGTPLPPSAPASTGRPDSDFPSSGPASASNPKNTAAPPPAATTPLSSRPGESADLRRRIFPTRPGASSSLDNSLVSTPGSNAFPERKKRKMGYLNNILYKTEICRDYQQTGTCPRGKSCQFAHGGAEVHHPKNHPLYKTAYCFDFKKDGQCPRGDACFHVHHTTEMREKPNRSRGQRGSRFGRQSRSTPKGSPIVVGRTRGGSGPPPPASSSGGSASSPGGTSGEALPNPSDVKNTMRLLQRLSSENTANLLKKLSEGDSLRGSPLRH